MASSVYQRKAVFGCDLVDNAYHACAEVVVSTSRGALDLMTMGVENTLKQSLNELFRINTETIMFALQCDDFRFCSTYL